MTDFDSREQFEELNAENGFNDESLAADNDLVMEQILDNINSTPIGQVLKKIASLPEVNQKRILGLRQEMLQKKQNSRSAGNDRGENRSAVVVY